MLKRLVVLCGGLALAGCAAFQGLAEVSGVKPPEVAFDKVTYRAADFEVLHCDVAFAITNPNRIGGRLEGYDVKLVVDGVTVADGPVDQALDLGPGKTGTLIVPAAVKWADLATVISSKHSVPDELPWTLTGAAHVKVGDQPLSLPINVTGALPVLRPPSIVPVALRVTKATFTSISVAIDVEMRSNGGHPIALGELTHELTVAGQRVLAGALAPAGDIPGSAVRTLNAEISTLQAGLVLARTLQSNQPVDVHFSGHTSVDTGFGVVPFSIDAKTKLATR